MSSGGLVGRAVEVCCSRPVKAVASHHFNKIDALVQRAECNATLDH